MDKPKNGFLTPGKSEWNEETEGVLSIELEGSKIKNKQVHLITKD
jgi:hypothetical protein